VGFHSETQLGLKVFVKNEPYCENGLPETEPEKIDGFHEMHLCKEDGCFEGFQWLSNGKCILASST